MQHSWWTASADVKQKIIQATDPQTTRSLCRLDDETRQICQSRLPVEQKYRTCLKSKDDAVECDQIPMFSEQQFRALIPAMIEIYPHDKVQLTHNFYSQTYKLPEEGYATALRKAKLLNTICAIVRPEFLLTDTVRRLPLPAYVDTAVLDTVTNEYRKVIGDKSDPETYFIMSMYLRSAALNSNIHIEIMYDRGVRDIEKGPTTATIFIGNMLGTDSRRFINSVIEDDFISDRIKESIRHIGLVSFIELVSEIEIVGGSPMDVFQLSRILKAAFDVGYFHNVSLQIDPNVHELVDLFL